MLCLPLLLRNELARTRSYKPIRLPGRVRGQTTHCKLPLSRLATNPLLRGKVVVTSCLGSNRAVINASKK